MLDKHYSYSVIDLETSINSEYKHKATPYDPVNKIVMEGVLRSDGWMEAGVASGIANAISTSEWIVGHNIGFDMAWIRRRIDKKVYPEVHDEVRNSKIWDTQIAEYILSNQTMTFPALDDVAKSRGGTLKDDRVTKMWAAGVRTEDMPYEVLREYLIGDLKNTELVFLHQLEETVNKGILPLMVSQMEARAATIEMNWNGMAVDQEFLLKLKADYAHQADLTRNEAFARLVGNDALEYVTLLSSPKQLSLALFGGEVEVDERVQDGFYKNGKPKYKKVTKTIALKGFGLASPEPKNAQGYYPTDDKVLSAILKQFPVGNAGPFIKHVQDHREAVKQYSTYCEGIQKAIMPDGLVHPNHNHCVTRTGRLSSSDPNLQNQTNGPIKGVFVSRWGAQGLIMEADFSQLEVVALAWLSLDAQLLYDIRNDVDIHTALFHQMYGKLPTKDERKWFKRLTFGLIYGAGASTLAENAGVEVSTAHAFIKTFYQRYPDVREWQDKNIHLVNEYSVYTGGPQKENVLKSATGRRYFFKQYDAPDWMKPHTQYSFSPTEIKNYPVQGLATGDIVPLALGKLYRRLMNDPLLKDKALLINTVHDSVLLDVHKDVEQLAAEFVYKSLTRTPQDFEETFGTPFNLPLEVKVSSGPNWLDQTELDMSYLKSSTSITEKAA